MTPNQPTISKPGFNFLTKNPEICSHEAGCADSVVQVGVVTVGQAVAVGFQDIVHLPQELGRFLHTFKKLFIYMKNLLQ